ncbi:MAG: DUF4331 domain-containing protein [Gammaproteobacteria bacterium]|nr:DUF4331 domain-containing protein [Gammaproteobacteria bacterium]MDH5652292.1 DUF4331 domain-containing protein [Gammaproteobacteria bacterium]
MSQTTFIVRLVQLISLFIVMTNSAFASDHVDGRVTIDHPMADISDLFAFPSPTKPGHMVVVMNVYPFVPHNGHFAHQVLYQIAVRNLELTRPGPHGLFKYKGATKVFSCRFETPHEGDHYATCTLPTGKAFKFKVDDVATSDADGVRIFAGRRADPFIFNSSWFAEIVKQGKLPEPGVSNNMSNINALSIIFEFDVKKVLGDAPTTLWAVAGETLTMDEGATTYRRIDRVGRPEVSNARLVDRKKVNDLRDLYNRQDTFAVDPAAYRQFRERLISNLTYFDNLDKVLDWKENDRAVFADVLLHDFLVLDMSKKFVIDAYFDIEMSTIRNQSYSRAGGRVPGDIIIDKLFTNMINGGQGRAITMGIAAPTALPQPNFPYLGEHHSNPIAWLLPVLARDAAVKLAME